MFPMLYQQLFGNGFSRKKIGDRWTMVGVGSPTMVVGDRRQSLDQYDCGLSNKRQLSA